MNPRLLDFVVCPLDRQPLELVAWESSPVTLSPEDAARAQRRGVPIGSIQTEVATGVLVNRRRNVFYPIASGVPRLLVFSTAFTRGFVETHSERLAKELPGFSLPSESGKPGEENVLRTFSSEWTNYEWDPRAYWGISAEDMFKTMRYALDLDTKGDALKGKAVLEVGIGIGGIADYVCRSTESELVGIDLSFAVDGAYKIFGNNRFFHIVQASAFAPPFPRGRFDYVYSQGVIHHTYSTKAAFESISALASPGGGRVYIWVCSPHDESRTLKRRILMKAENLLRPIYSRLPDKIQTAALMPWVPLYMVHQALLKMKDGTNVNYGFGEAMHAARDRFTPPFAHRHTNEEVASWFEDAGFRDLSVLGKRPPPPYTKSLNE